MRHQFPFSFWKSGIPPVFLPNVSFATGLGLVNANTLPSLTLTSDANVPAHTPSNPLKYNHVSLSGMTWNAKNSTSQYKILLWCNTLTIDSGNFDVSGNEQQNPPCSSDFEGGSSLDGGSGGGGGAGGGGPCQFPNGGAGGSGVDGTNGEDGSFNCAPTIGGLGGTGYGHLSTSAFTLMGGASQETGCPQPAVAGGKGFGGGGYGGQGNFQGCCANNSIPGPSGASGPGGIVIVANQIILVTGTGNLFAFGGNSGGGCGQFGAGMASGGGVAEVYAGHYTANALNPVVQGGTAGCCSPVAEDGNYGFWQINPGNTLTPQDYFLGW